MQIRNAMDRKWEGFDARRGEEKIQNMSFWGRGGLANARGGGLAFVRGLGGLMPLCLAFWPLCLLP